MEHDVVKAFAEIEKEFGFLSGLHNNAGIHLGGGAGDGPAAEVDLAVWRRTLDINLTGQFLCTKAALPLMLPHGGGSIVNMASVSGALLGTLAAGYNASKAAVVGLTRSLVIGYAAQGIRANAICPGPVGTAMTQAVLNTPDVRQRLIEGIPAGRMVSVEDLGNLVVFLMSPAGGFVTGAVIPMDGGLSIY
jgi:NAD(P)-dependent dehydrogenase (short-subunit alcohol dehydrogenase family)